MRHLTQGGVLASLVAVALVCGPASVQGGKGGDKKVDTPKPENAPPVKWDYDVVDQDDKPVEKGSFVARGFAIYNGFGRRVGTYEDVSPTEVSMTMTEGKLKGKVDLRRETPTTLTWKGELERGSGLTYKITVVFEKYK